MYGGRVRVH